MVDAEAAAVFRRTGDFARIVVAPVVKRNSQGDSVFEFIKH